jgi:hypothetical protein
MPEVYKNQTAANESSAKRPQIGNVLFIHDLTLRRLTVAVRRIQIIEKKGDTSSANRRTSAVNPARRLFGSSDAAGARYLATGGHGPS